MGLVYKDKGTKPGRYGALKFVSDELAKDY
jgi:hypothetical protein